MPCNEWSPVQRAKSLEGTLFRGVMRTGPLWDKLGIFCMRCAIRKVSASSHSEGLTKMVPGPPALRSGNQASLVMNYLGTLGCDHDT
jgi:hypothetical protein